MKSIDSILDKLYTIKNNGIKSFIDFYRAFRKPGIVFTYEQKEILRRYISKKTNSI